MEISRREFFRELFSKSTGLAAIIQASDASAFEYDERGYNHLIPKYGAKNFWNGEDVGGGIKGVPQYVKRFKIEDGRIITESYVGTQRYAITITTGKASTSITLFDDKGDGIFRKKFPASELFYPPPWVHMKYVGKDKKPI